jgi:hypothetical protein
MRTVKYCLLAALTTCIVGLGVFQAQDKDKPKYDIKEIMEMAHKDGLLKKAVTMRGTKEDKKKLLELYTALSENTPKKGDKEVWKQKTEAIVKAAQALVAGEADADALIKATNCLDCHKQFK